MTLAEVARLLGHSSLQMTYRYSNATPETTKRAADMLNKLALGNDLAGSQEKAIVTGTNCAITSSQ